MANTVLLRIDDRLMHGQIGRSWFKAVAADIVVVVNDKVSKDENSQKLMDLVTPLGSKTYFLSLDDAIKNLNTLEDDKDAIVLVENPKDALELLENGIDVSSVNVGNIQKKYNSKILNDSISIDDEDIDYFKKIKDLGKQIDIRTLASDESINVDKIFS